MPFLSGLVHQLFQPALINLKTTYLVDVSQQKKRRLKCRGINIQQSYQANQQNMLFQTGQESDFADIN